MDQISDVGRAFPSNRSAQFGMSLRDYFAGQALASMDTDGYTTAGLLHLAERAYDIADAMLAEREKERA